MSQIIFEATAARQALKSRSLRLLVEENLPEILALRALGISWQEIAKNFQAVHERVWFDAPRKMTIETGRARRKAEAEDLEGLRAKIEKAKFEVQSLGSEVSPIQNRTAPVAQAPVAVSRPAVVAPIPVQKPAAPVATAPVAASRSAVVSPEPVVEPQPQNPSVSVKIPPELAPGTFVLAPTARLPRDRPFVWLLAEIANAKNLYQQYFNIPDGRPGREGETLPVEVPRPRDLLSGKITDWAGLAASYGERR